MAKMSEVSFSWNVPEVKYLDDGLIVEIKYELVGTKGDLTSKLGNKHYITGDPKSKDFIPEADVKKEDAVKWLEADLGREMPLSDDIKAMIAGPDQTAKDIPDPLPRLTMMKQQIVDTITAKETAPNMKTRSLD